MTFQPRLRAAERIRAGTDARPLRLAAIGDGLVGPVSLARRAGSGLERAFLNDRFMVWLRTLLPGLDAPESAIFGAPGETSVMVAKRALATLDARGDIDAVLVCAGLQDCFAATRGVAPSLEEMATAFEALAVYCLARGVKPVFMIPPPDMSFANGLFADRYVAIAATLRRLCRGDEGPALIDPIAALTQPRAPGVSPDPRHVSGDRLSALGAFRLAGAVAARLRDLFPGRALAAGAPPDAALNPNPRLAGARGVIERGVAGSCAAASRLDAVGSGGARIRGSVARGGGQRIVLSGRYSTGWGFARLHQRVPEDVLSDLDAGDAIEALCDVELAGAVENIAGLSLHATAVWDNDFAGLHSSLYGGGPGVAEAFAGRLRTPSFAPPRKLRALHVSLQVHLVPGADLAARGEVILRSIAVRKAQSPAIGKIENGSAGLSEKAA